MASPVPTSITKQRDELYIWVANLQNVAQNSSSENMSLLRQLADRIPRVDFMDYEIKRAVALVRKAAITNSFEPGLKDQATRAFLSMFRIA